MQRLYHTIKKNRKLIMIIDKQIGKYIIFAEDSIINALKKISDNQNRIIFSVTETGILEGILTDGDFRRWLVKQPDIDLNRSVNTITNKQFKWAKVDDAAAEIEAQFSESIQFIPLLDKNRHLVAIARPRRQSDGIQIGEFTVSESDPCFIIAEIGINHNGSLELAKQMIDAAVLAGADCAKFQMRDLGSLYGNAGNADDASLDLGSQYTLNLLSRFQLTPAEMFEAFDYCKSRSILPLCTPWDFRSLSALEEYGMPAYKVASADLTNHDLLRAIANTGKPLIASTGMSTEQEIKDSTALLQHLGAKYILLHCNSTYPAPFKDVNLNYISRLREIGKCPVGYSGHERGINVAIAAVAKGAKVIEKHFTLDKTMEGNDHKVSLLPQEFAAMVEGIRQVEESLGTGGERRVSQGEFMNRENLAKSLVINCNLAQGETITAEMIEVKSPGKGLQPNRKVELVGKTAKRNLKAGDFFYPSDLLETVVQARDYRFNRRWGVPVRYHDFQAILRKTNPDLLEFHLSFKDLDEDIYKYFDRTYDLDLVVHSPELFAGDHLLDLCSTDADYRRHSQTQLQRVIEVARSLLPFFSKSTRPCIVANVGGYGMDALPQTERDKLYRMLAESLSQLDTEGVEIIPQTMPPFPWYFGGQRYQNLFVTAEDTAQFCQEYGYRVCFDISHSKLACNHHKQSFKQFVQQIAPFSAHLHISDAEGVDGEGLQVGEGEIDFVALWDDLDQLAPDATFIPEIWQGHKNEGEGFWQALEKLETVFAIQ